MTSFKQLNLKSLHPLIRSLQPRPTFFFPFSTEMDEKVPDRKSDSRAGVEALAWLFAPSSFQKNVSVSARLTHGALGEIMELAR